MKLRPSLSLILVWMMLLSLLPQRPAFTVMAQDVDETVNSPGGLRFRLSEGTEKVTAPTPSPAVVAAATSLSEADARKLLARLPALIPETDDAVSFKFRERSLPPPRAGQTIQAAFALPTTGAPPAPTHTTAPLEVSRFAPEGEVELAPMLSVTFSQPMVTVASQEDAAASVPLTLSPQPKGKWRWLGTQTLIFQPEAEGGRLPMATVYTVNIPAGTRSVLGNALTEAKTFEFSTPPPTLKTSYPYGASQRRDPLMFLEFDQRIDPARVLERLRIQPGAGLRLRLATAEEIAATPSVQELVKQAHEGRWLVVRAVGADGSTRDVLPFDTNIWVLVTAGTPSVEGGRTTTIDQNFNFKTHGPMRVASSHCDYQGRCSPFDNFRITFSNQLDTEAFLAAYVKITPEIPNVKIGASYNGTQIDGIKRSNTTYTVTIDRALKDTFGQTLTGENQVSFIVTTADPTLFASGNEFLVLDPVGPRAFTVYSINYARLRVALYKVTPEDWSQFRLYRSGRITSGNEIPSPPGKLVSDKIIDVNSGTDQLIETAIDLSPALNDGYGQVFVKVEPVEPPGDQPVNVYANRSNKAEAWVQSTEIGLDAFSDRAELVVWANSLRNGSPLAGVELSVSPDDLTGVTGTDGLAHLAFKVPPPTKEEQRQLIVARRGNDVAILVPEFRPYYYGGSERGSWRRQDSHSSVSWYVFDDRRLYRPGEEVNIKGWVRRVNLSSTGDTGLFKVDPDEALNYIVRDSQNNEITKGSVKLNALAGFNFKVQLPATMNLGSARVEFKFEEDRTENTHEFQVQEFRRPEFEITARTSEAPHFVGSFATATMTATYYSGGGLADTEVNWTVTSRPTNYTPPNRSGYTFGTFYAWWRERSEANEAKVQMFKGRTDAEGKHTLRMDFDGVTPPRPSSVTAQALVQDVNRQTLAETTTLLVHPAEVYVGLKSSRTFVQKGEPFDVVAIVTDLDGKALAGRNVSLRLARLDYIYLKGEWTQEERDVQEQTLKSGADAVNTRFQTKEGGMYRLTARVRDDRERLNESELSLWVAGGKLPAQRNVTQEKVELIPDRKEYAGNEVAEILVQAPFAPAEGVLTIRRSGLLRTERFTMNESSYTLRVPLEEAMTPNVYVQVDLVGASVRVDDEGNPLTGLPKRPAFASGEIKLEIPPTMRRLSVKATPREAVLEPGGETLVDVEVKDSNGRGVPGTDTAVVVVDESVLALTDYRIIDPLIIFYPERSENVNDYHLRERLALATPQEIKRLAFAEGGFGAGRVQSLPVQARDFKGLLNLAEAEAVYLSADSSRSMAVTTTASGQISARQNFNALAVFAASLPTDASGHAQVKVKLPDNLTRYRVMAVSVAGGKLSGFGESAITARKQLMARPSAPRFLNYGDAAELPVVLQNQTNQAMNVSVAVRASNANLTEGSGRRVTVPANNRIEVRFPIAAVKPGTARFQIVASSGEKADAAEISLPVYTPATTEAFATYGVIDNGSIAQTVKAPADAVKTFGGLEITTASTQLQELTDAVIYLYNYPYSCAEQIASRVIAIAALKDVLTAFEAKGLPAPNEMRESVSRDIKLLQGLQNDDGGFGFWRHHEPSFAYVSVHVAHALIRAQSKGFAVPQEMLTKSRDYLRQIEDKLPKEYSVEARRAIQAYALYVRALMKDRDTPKARKLIAEAGGVERLSLESLGWLLPVMSGDPASANEVDMIRRHLNNRVTETAGAAHFADSYSDGAYTILHSNRRADGVILEALIGDQPQSDLIAKLVRGLLAGRNRGHWLNTQENVFVLLALDRYFATYERVTPDFVTRVWLGNDYAGEQTFKGRSIDRQQLNLPMTVLVERTANTSENLTISKEGAGRLYFRIGTQYAPANLKLAAADYGFQVERKYEAIDDPADVRLEADGTWQIRSGARIRVRLTMSNPARRYHVALVDPLPAGLEALNPALATTEQLPDEETGAGANSAGRSMYDFLWSWRRTWYEHQNLRDERAEAFTQMLWEGVHEYSYFARATTPGLFVVPPTKAEEMYAPETFGRGQSDRVRVR